MLCRRLYIPLEDPISFRSLDNRGDTADGSAALHELRETYDSLLLSYSIGNSRKLKSDSVTTPSFSVQRKKTPRPSDSLHIDAV